MATVEAAATGLTESLRERRIDYILDRKLRLRPTGPYAAKSGAEIGRALSAFFATEGLSDVSVTELRRLTGGASKEMFVFTLSHRDAPTPERLVLRMDPLESTVETCRGREAQVLRAVSGTVPVPDVRFVDDEGEKLGRPSLITAFVEGVTMPSDIGDMVVSGMGGAYGAAAERLAPQFVANLVAIHDMSLADKDLGYFDVPEDGTRQAALWQVNTLARAWQDDMVEPLAMMTYVERWLSENAPVCERPCLVHADYRLGNFMYREEDAQISAILDWELSHIGDYHEDLAYVIQQAFSSPGADREPLVCGLMTRNAFLSLYEELSGRRINSETLRFYEVMNNWKLSVLVRASAVRAAVEGNSHQDLVIAWLSAGSGVLLEQIPALLETIDAS